MIVGDVSKAGKHLGSGLNLQQHTQSKNTFYTQTHQVYLGYNQWHW